MKKPFLEQAAKDLKRFQEEFASYHGRCRSLGLPVPNRKRNLAKLSENDDADSSDSSVPKEKKVKPEKAEKKKRDNESDYAEPKIKKVKKEKVSSASSSEPVTKKRPAEESDEAPKKKKPRKAKVPEGDGATVSTKHEAGEPPSDVPVPVLKKRKKAEGEAKPVAAHAAPSPTPRRAASPRRRTNRAWRSDASGQDRPPARRAEKSELAAPAAQRVAGQPAPGTGTAATPFSNT